MVQEKNYFNCKFFMKSEAGNSNPPGTGSVRVSAQGLYIPDFIVNFHHEHSVVPGFPRMCITIYTYQ